MNPMRPFAQHFSCSRRYRQDVEVVVHLLWTGGWDSTYRLCELLFRTDVVVEPHYLVSKRRSTEMELRQMAAMRRAIDDIAPAAAKRLKPLIVTEQEEVRVCPDRHVRFQRLRHRRPLGVQYEWLSEYASSMDHPLELAVHADDKAHDFLQGDVRPVTLPYGAVKELVARPSDPDLELFRPFRFPLFDLSKLGMGERAERLGFGEVMQMTWFCHRPKDGQPCGVCEPCRDAMREGLGWRIPRNRRVYSWMLTPVLALKRARQRSAERQSLDQRSLERLDAPAAH